MKEAFEAFQVKLNNKEPYQAYWIRKAILPTVMMDIKHRTKVSTLNNTSQFLMLITDGMYNFICTNWIVFKFLSICMYNLIYTNSYSTNLGCTVTDYSISDIDNKAKQELQGTVISIKLFIRNLFHRKCVYML